MPASTVRRAKKKVAKKKKAKKKAVPKDTPLIEENIEKIADLIANRIKEPRELKGAMRWADGSGPAMKRMVSLVKAIEHYRGEEEERYKHLQNICKLIPQVYRDTGNINHGELTMAGRFLRDMDKVGEKIDTVRMQLLGIVKNFRKATYSPRENRLIVETEDCYAKDICFGPFKIDCWIDTGHLRLTALEPNEPKTRMVHPHVDHQGGNICLGNGGDAFAKAVREFRICDALLIARGVLNNYASNPFHRISEWTQRMDGCVTCGRNNDGMRNCRGCRKVICREHAFVCVRCGSYMCHEHVKKCRDCGNPVCGPCRRDYKTCGQCSPQSKKGKPKWVGQVDKFKKIRRKIVAPTNKPEKSDKERLGGGFLG